MTLTISGGISLGAYESGFNWTLVHLLKEMRSEGLLQKGRPGFPYFDTTESALKAFKNPQSSSAPVFTPDLIAVTGASAGTINALLTALTWCHKGDVDRLETLESNLFWHVWTHIDLKDLVPSALPLSRQQREDELKRLKQEYLDHYTPILNGYYPEIVPNSWADIATEATTASAPKEEPLARYYQNALGGYRQEDKGGLMTRNAFSLAEAFLARELSYGSRFQAGCSVPLGFTIASPTSSELRLNRTGGESSEGLRIKTNRYSTLLQFKVPAENDSGDSIAFKQYPIEAERDLQRFIERRLELNLEGKDAPVPIEKIIKLLHASSAFPLAFAPVESGGLTKGFDGLLMDGGVLDNIPLGLAHYFVLKDALANEKPTYLHKNVSTPLNVMNPQSGMVSRSVGNDQRESVPASSGAVDGEVSKVTQRRDATGNVPDYARMLYLDPSRLRGEYAVYVEEGKTVSSNTISPLTAASSYLLESLSVAREFELQSLQRYAWNMRPRGWDKDTWRLNPNLSSRGAPLAGELMGAFGAFVYQPFRQYDYLVGAHDAIVNLAQEICNVTPTQERALTPNAMPATEDRPFEGLERDCVTSYYSLLREHIPATEDTNRRVLDALARAEGIVHNSAENSADTDANRSAQSTLDPSSQTSEARKKEVQKATELTDKLVLQYLISDEGQAALKLAQKSPIGVVGLLSQIRAELMRGEQINKIRPLPAIVANPENELLDVAMNLATRSAQQECIRLGRECGKQLSSESMGKSEPGDIYLAIGDILPLAVHKVRSVYRLGADTPSLYLSRGMLTLPTLGATLLPTSFMLDVVHGTGEFQWSAGTTLGRNLPGHPGFVGGLLLDPRLTFAEPTPDLSNLQVGVLLGPSLRFHSPLLSRLELMGRLSTEPCSLLSNPQMRLGAELGVNILANTLRLSVLYGKDFVPEGALPVTIRLGITDIPATTYWLGRALVHSIQGPRK